MTKTLNFGVQEKGLLKGLFSGFKKVKTKTRFEESRWRVMGCTVTLYNTGKLVIQGKKKKQLLELIYSGLALREEIALGIDESGRGENFGPLVVAGVLGDKNLLREIRDSKKTNIIEKKKEVVSRNAEAIATIEFSSKFIDSERRKGITLNELQAKAIKAINFALNPSNEWQVIVDGKPLKGCNAFKFMVKGDDLEPVVGAASVIAKFAREKSGDKGKRETWKNSR